MMKNVYRSLTFLIAIGIQPVIAAAPETNALDDGRILLLDDYLLTGDSPPTWEHVGPAPSGAPTVIGGLFAGTNHYHRTGWVFQNVRMGQRNNPAAAMCVPPQIPSNYSANLMNTLEAAIYSPVFTNGIGTLYFEAINVASTAPVGLEVYIATNMVGGAALSGSMTAVNVDWQPILSTNLTATSINGFVRVMKKIEISQPVVLRIKRSTTMTGAADNFYACVDNIRVSPSVPDIVFSGINAVVSGGGTFVECVVSNTPGTLNLTDHTSRDIELCYRWFSSSVTQAWASAAMVYQTGTGTGGDGEEWKADITPTFQPGMALEYYLVYSRDTVYRSLDYTDSSPVYAYPPETGMRYPEVDTLYQMPGASAKVTVTFHALGGTVTPPTKEYSEYWTYNDAGGLPTPEFLGNAFGGWFTDTEYTNLVSGTTMVLAEVTDLYAKWAPCTYIVRYNPNGGMNTMADDVFTYGVVTNLKANAFMHTGYGFTGWATNTPYTVVYTNCESVSNLSAIQDAVVNLYAVWTGLVYTVTFDPQSGAVSPTSLPVTYGAQYGFHYGGILPTPIRTGYTFDGWYMLPNGGGALITATSNVTQVGNHTLYAKWTVNTYTVTFNPQGGTVSPTSKTVTYGGLYGGLPVPAQPGFVFAGWFTATGGGGTEVTASTPVTITAAQTLFAKWVDNTDWYTTNTLAIIYIIMNEEELHGFSHLVNTGTTNFFGATVILGADLDMSATPAPWIPIGTNEPAVFQGTFDGQGKVIAGLAFNDGTFDNVGLFGILGEDGIVKNVHLSLTGCTLAGRENVGGIAGSNYGLIQNCQVLEGSIEGTAANIGGLVGCNWGILENCFSTAFVNGPPSRGGLAGRNESGAVIQNCYWWTAAATGAVGANAGGTTSDVYSFSGYPGTLAGEAFGTLDLSSALNGWVQSQSSAFYWWTAGTDSSHPVLTQFAPSLIVQQLSEARILLFDDYHLTGNSPPTWVHEGPAPSGAPTVVGGLLAGSNHYHRTGWVFQNVRMGQRNNPAAAMCVPPQIPSNYSANLMNTIYSAIYSPIFTNGVGTLYFEVINTASTAPVEIFVDIATTMNGGATLSGSNMAVVNADWIYVFSTRVQATSVNDFTRIAEKLDIRQPVAIRIRRDTLSGAVDNFYACIDNIRVSLPPADIVMSKPLVPFDNGYPSVNTPSGKVQCWLDNRTGPYSTSYLGGTRTNVQIVSRWNYIPQVANPPPGWGWISAWQTNTLACVEPGDGTGNGEKWEGVIPPYLDVGNLEYYFIGKFNGVRYQSLDYTERGYVYPPEDPSPKIYAASTRTITNAVSGGGPIVSMAVTEPFQFGVRQYPATFGEAVAMTDQFGPVKMYLSGTNEWQARVSVVGTSITNITWYFKGSGEYLGDYAFSTDTVYWCNKTMIRGGVLPYGDNVLRTDEDTATNETYRLEVRIDPTESNYVLLTLNTEQVSFMAGRGEYQDFNLWNPGDAGENTFTDTSDKYPKTAYSQNFDSWTTNTFFAISNYFGNLSVTNLADQTFLWPENAVGTIDWMASSFGYAIERTPTAWGGPDAPDGNTWRNQAIRLLGGNNSLGLGYIQGNDRQFSDEVLRGLGSVSFKARLSQKIVPGVYNYNATVHTKHYTSSNYMVRLTGTLLLSSSVEQPSVSLIAYYQSPLNFYEYRVTQIPDPAAIPNWTGAPVPARDDLLQHEIIRWSGGIPTALNRTTAAGRLTDSSLLGGSGNFEFRVYTDPSTGITTLAGHLGTTDNATSVTATQQSSVALKYGTFGIHSSDSTIDVSNIRTRPTTTGAMGSGTEWVNELTPATDWALSLQSAHNGARITTLAPTNQINVLTGPTVNGPWTTRQTFPITSFGYVNITANIQVAQPMCVRLQVVGGSPSKPSSDIVVDSIIATSWRGENIPKDPAITEWAVTESRLVSNPASGGVDNKVSVRMDATQAQQSGPALPQSICSPRIMGVGTISFDYRSLTTNDTAIRIQYFDARFAPTPTLTSFAGWEPLTNIVCNSSTWTTVNLYFGMLAQTNVFVRFLHDWEGVNAQSRTNSIIEIDNITIWNNPTNSPNDWVAYNAKITNTETNRWWIDGPAPVNGRNASLNNSTTNMAYPSPQGQFNPYIMSPKLMYGLGRISFIARAYDPTNALVNNTSISVYATTMPWAINYSDLQWEKLHTFYHITNAFYRPFSFAVTNGLNNYTAVKLVVDGVTDNDPSVQRVCIDEILVTELIYAKFDISDVKLMLPDLAVGGVWPETFQPLEGEDIGVSAKLTNVLLHPSNIVMYVSYVIGTNTWGVMNSPGRVTVQMEEVDPVERIWRTREPVISMGIPEQEKNTVVQFLVWAEYEDAGKLYVYQQPGTFKQPEWYYPVDLNERFKSRGWSPYYIVYDVPPGSVWINEVNAYEFAGAPGLTWEWNPYIEIAMPAWMSLSGWMIECVTRDPLYPDVYTMTLPPNLPAKTPHPDPNANGYAFFLIGPPQFPPFAPGVAPLPIPADYTVLNLVDEQDFRKSIMPYRYAGGFRLRRPMGMYEQTIAYEWDSGFSNGRTWARDDPQGKFRFIGAEDRDGSISFTGTVVNAGGTYVREDSTNTWTMMKWTLGAPNIGQVLPNAPEPGGLNVLIKSEMSSTNGLQNNLRAKTYLVKVRRGDSTNITYQADSWWRLYSVKEDGVERLSPSPAKTYDLQLDNIQSNIIVSVLLDVREDLLEDKPTPDILDWLQKKPDEPFAPTYLNALPTPENPSPKQLSLRERYWIDADPTTTNLFTFHACAKDIDQRPLYLPLVMELNSNRVDRLQGGSVVQAWATYSLSPMDWFMVGQFFLSGRSFDGDNRSRVYINAFPASPQAFFTWKLNLEDPRAATVEMINQPKP